MNTETVIRKQVDPQRLEQKVKNLYREVALHPRQPFHFEMGEALAERLGYPKQLLDRLPSEAKESFAGVGYHFGMALIRPGEYVIDLGSGSGMDVFYAALEVGPEGKVTGIDMTIEQLEKATRLKKEFGFDQVVFVSNYIEDLSLDSGIADVIISNGAINLSFDKGKVFREAARVLKRGGRLAISDIVSSVRLPESISCSATLWAACIGGAMQKDEYLGLIEDSGFRIMEIRSNPYEFISNSARNATTDYGIESVSLVAVKL